MDDHPDAVEVWAIYLRSSGFTVDTAHDGEQALQLARASPPDVVVTDLTLPQLSGLELAQALRADEATRHVPLIAATGCADDDILSAARAWFQVVLGKPCAPEELVRQLRIALAGSVVV